VPLRVSAGRVGAACEGHSICGTCQEKGRRSLDPHMAWGGERSCRLCLVRDQTSPSESRQRRRGSSGLGTGCGRRALESVLGGWIRLGGRGRGAIAGRGGGNRRVGQWRRWTWISGGGGVVGVEDLTFEYEGKRVSRG
jgi:hypothetical protein